MSVAANSRPLTGAKPKISLPAGATDCHMHFYLPGHQSQPGGPAIPEWATTKDYRCFQQWLGLERVVMVQPNAYQFDNSAQIAALRSLGRGKARAIIAAHAGMDRGWLREITDLGVVGARIVGLPGGAATMKTLPEIARLAQDFGWSIIIQFNGSEFAEHFDVLNRLEIPFVIDHLGKFSPPVPAGHAALDMLSRLIDRGNAWFKLAGAYEISREGPPDFADVAPIAARLIKHAPERILWGSNWPHVGVPRERYPDDVALLDTMMDWIGPANLARIFVDNPARLYGF